VLSPGRSAAGGARTAGGCDRAGPEAPICRRVTSHRPPLEWWRRLPIYSRIASGEVAPLTRNRLDFLTHERVYDVGKADACSSSARPTCPREPPEVWPGTAARGICERRVPSGRVAEPMRVRDHIALDGRAALFSRWIGAAWSASGPGRCSSTWITTSGSACGRPP
jgi:hypothetical protein